MTTPDIVSRARKLIRLRDRTNSAGEAKAAAKALAELLDRYRLEEAALEMGDDAAEAPSVFAIADEPLTTYRRAERWRTDLAVFLSRHYGVAIWQRTVLGKRSICMCGRPDDVAIFREMYSWLSADIPRLCAKECVGLTTNARWSWRAGFVLGIEKQLAEARAAAVKQSGATGAAMVLANRQNDAQSFLERQLQIKRATVRRDPSTVDAAALSRGFAAGYQRHVGRQMP